MMNRDPLAYLGEYGWLFRIMTDIDATGVNTKQIEFKSPDGTKTLKNATAVTTDADGDYQYQVETGFFDTPGWWTAQLILTWAGTKLLKSSIFRFRIGDDQSTN